MPHRIKRGFLWDTPISDCVRQIDAVYGSGKPFSDSEYAGDVATAYRQWCSDGAQQRAR